MEDRNLMAYFDRIAGAYQSQISAVHRDARELNLQRLDVQAGERVLDVGCATGLDLVRLASAAGAQHVEGLDVSSEMLEIARQRLAEHGLSEVQLHCRKAPPLPQGDDSLEVVCLSLTLELQPLPAAWELLGEVGRVLRAGGRLGAVCLGATWPDPGGLADSASHWLDRYLRADHDTVDWKTMLEDAGLKVSQSQRMELRDLALDVMTAERSGAAALPPVAESVKALGSRKPMDRIRARQRLAVGGAEAREALLPLLDHRKEALRAEAAKCLAWMGSPDSAEKLVEALEDNSQKVRWLAAEALTALGAEGGALVVRRLTRTSDDSHRLYESAGHVIRALHRRGHEQYGPLVEALAQSQPQTAVPVAASRLT